MARGKQQVVVVEDDPGMRQALGRFLRIAGYAPLAYASAEAFIDDQSSSAATCLILDVQLPGITGFDLRDRLSRDGREVPVIFITAYDEPEVRRRAAEGAAVAFLTKPFDGRDLIDAVMRAHGESPPQRGRRRRDGR